MVIVMGRLVFLDLDGTLLTHHQEVPADAQDALHAAKRNGHQLWIASGRANCEIYPSLLSYGFQGIVGANGAYAQMLTEADLDGSTVKERPENMVFDHRIGPDDVAFLQAYLAEHGGLSWWTTPSRVYTEESFLSMFLGGSSDPFQPAPWQAYVDQVRPFVCLDNPPSASKLVALLPHASGVSLAQFTAALGPRFCVVESSINPGLGVAAEVTLAGISKGSALTEVASSLWFKMADTVAVGDSANDEEMLRLAGVGVAMGNGTLAAKQAADLVTEDISEGGLSKAFQMAGLI